MDDQGKLYPYDFSEYMNAIQAAPPGTWMGIDEVVPVQWMKCTDCGAEMSAPMTPFHLCAEGKQ